MKRNRFNAEFWKSIVLKTLAIRAFAEEVDPSKQPTPPQPNYEQLIAQARQEEKAKLYPQLEKLKAEKEANTNSINQLLLENAGLKEQLKTIQDKGADSEEVKTFQAKIEVLTKEKEKLEEELKKAPKADAIREELKKEYEAKEYLRTKLDESKDTLLSVFTSEVGGNTKEEIDASLAKAIEKSNKVREDLGITAASKKGTTDINKSSETKRNKGNFPAGTDTKTEYTAQDIRNMSPAEYEEFRRKVLKMR